jgi:rubrerythrin
MFGFLKAHSRARHLSLQEMREHSYQLKDMIGFMLLEAMVCPDCEFVYVGKACPQCGSYHGQVELSSLMPWEIMTEKEKIDESTTKL